MLISVLCRSSPNMKKKALSFGTLEVLMSELSFKSGNKNEEVKVLFAVVHALWNLVSQMDENEKVFLSKEGAFRLLDLLVTEKDRDLKRHVLGCLIDLMDNQRTIKHILCWRYAESNHNIGQILVALWKAEEKLLES